MPDKLFEPCQCDSAPTTRHDRVQVFLPATHPKLWGRGLRSPQLVIDGAILVGHSFTYPLRWGTRREPEEGEPEISIEISHELLHDSGIGSSKSPESVQGSGSMTNPQQARSQRDPLEVGSSNSAVFLHANQQFVYCENSSGSGPERSSETSMLPTSSNAGLRGMDRRAGGKGQPKHRE